MTSCPIRETNDILFRPRIIHFIRIIFDFEESPVNEKLSLPPRFIRRYGNDIPSTVLIKAPCSTVWQVGLLHLNKKVWFHDGWKEFADHYSLGFGHFLLFTYEGGSEFSVVVFDKSATSVEDSACKCWSQHRGSDQREESHEPTSTVLLSDSDSLKLRERELRGHANLRRSARVLGIAQNANMKINQNHSSGVDSKAIEAASKFSSNYPFFKVVMRIAQLESNVTIPLKFVREHIHDSLKVKLQTADGSEPMPVILNVYPRFGGQGKLSAGWPAFSKKNSLQLGDVCVFELIKNDTLKVSIFRNNG